MIHSFIARTSFCLYQLKVLTSGFSNVEFEQLININICNIDNILNNEGSRLRSVFD